MDGVGKARIRMGFPVSAPAKFKDAFVRKVTGHYRSRIAKNLIQRQDAYDSLEC
jgi:hypothetical protein